MYTRDLTNRSQERLVTLFGITKYRHNIGGVSMFSHRCFVCLAISTCVLRGWSLSKISR